MKNYLVVFLLFAGSLVSAQIGTEVFKKKSAEYAQFKYDRKEYDSLIIWNRQMSIPAMNGYYSAKALVTFIVDTLGNLDKLELNAFEMEKISGYLTLAETPEQVKAISNDFKAEALRLAGLSSGLWIPAKVNGKLVECRLFTYVYFNTETERNFGPGDKNKDNPSNIVRTVYMVKPNEGYKQTQLYNVAERKVKNNKPDLAAVYYKQAVRYNENKIANTPNNIDAYYDMGVCYSKLNDFSHACKCWKVCLKMGDGSVQSLLDKYCK